jgi:hypothetical protein
VSYAFAEARQFWSQLRTFELSLVHLNSLYEFDDDPPGTTYFHFSNDIPAEYIAARSNCIRFGNELELFLGMSEPQLIGDGVHWTSGAAEFLRLSECSLKRHVSTIMRRYNTNSEFYDELDLPTSFCFCSPSVRDSWTAMLNYDLCELERRLAIFMCIIRLIRIEYKE